MRRDVASAAGDGATTDGGDDGGGAGADRLQALTSALSGSRVDPAYGCALRCAAGPTGPDSRRRTSPNPRPRTRLFPRTGTPGEPRLLFVGLELLLA